MYIALFNTNEYNTPEEAREDYELFALAENIPADFTPEHFDMIEDAVQNTSLMTGGYKIAAVLVEGTFGGGKITYPVVGSEWYEEN